MPIKVNMEVTILILIDGFLQYKITSKLFLSSIVTILILIDGFLQWITSWNTNPWMEESQSLF